MVFPWFRLLRDSKHLRAQLDALSAVCVIAYFHRRVVRHAQSPNLFPVKRSSPDEAGATGLMIDPDTLESTLHSFLLKDSKEKES